MKIILNFLVKYTDVILVVCVDKIVSVTVNAKFYNGSIHIQ